MDRNDESRVKEILTDAGEELDRIASKLHRYLEFTCKSLEGRSDMDFRVRLIDPPRVKRAASVIRAMKELGLSPEDVWSIDDIIGTRIVVVTDSDIQLLIETLRRDNQHSLVDLSQSAINDDSGYRAVHLKGWHDTAAGKIGCEIQIRTMLQDAWAFVSRADVHKRDDLPETLTKMARIQAHHLAAADDSLQLIRDEAKRLTPLPDTVEVRDARASDGTDVTAPRTSPDRSSPDRPGGEEEAPTEVPPPTDEELRDDDFIIRTSASEKRKQEFLQSYLEDRSQTGTTKKLFRRAGVFQERAEKNEKLKAGFNVLLRKGPLVEGSRWISYTTWGFAVAAEQYLLRKLEGLLRGASHHRSPRTLQRNWAAMLAEVDALAEEARRARYEPTLIVVTGSPRTDWLLDLHRHATPEWDLTEELKSIWIIGSHNDIPILQIGDTDESQLYVVDVAKFATLTQHGEDAEISIEEFDQSRARELLEQRPDLVSVPQNVWDTPDERLRQLQLHVGLLLYESYELEVRDPNAVFSAALLEG